MEPAREYGKNSLSGDGSGGLTREARLVRPKGIGGIHALRAGGLGP